MAPGGRDGAAMRHDRPMGEQWTADSIPDLTGRTYVVTGATSGIGLQTAVALAEHGGTVVVTGRNPDRLAAAMGQVRRVAAGPAPVAQVLDLADLASVRRAAEEIAGGVEAVHVLVNNAGVMATPECRTADGFELQIGTNHLGHFALTGLLLPAMPILDPAADARVVTVSSTAHQSGKVVPDDLSFDRRRYLPWKAYSQSKLANLLFTYELHRRAAAARVALRAVAAHPGWAATNLQFAGPEFTHNAIGRAAMTVLNRVVGQSATDGALPTLFAATDPSVMGGEYFGPDGLFEMRGHPRRSGRGDRARDAVTAERLWQVSEQLTGVHVAWPPP